MSKLTHFEALQLAAILSIRREYAIQSKDDVKDLFALAQLIQEENQERQQLSIEQMQARYKALSS